MQDKFTIYHDDPLGPAMLRTYAYERRNLLGSKLPDTGEERALIAALRAQADQWERLAAMKRLPPEGRRGSWLGRLLRRA